MTKSMTKREERRLAVQAELDAAKDQAERNRMGQFATPTELAVQILEYAKGQLNETEAVRFIDPAIGTGSFYSALLQGLPGRPLDMRRWLRSRSSLRRTCDESYGRVRCWMSAWRTLHWPYHPSDKEKFNLLVCNPPYVRHHHIASKEKQRLKALTREACGIKVNGLAGLYCYFLGLSHQWMAEGGLAGWLIPSEFMDVNYGASVKSYLLDKVTLLHIHRFDPKEVQFGDALVSSAVVWFIKKEPPDRSQSAYDLWRFTAAAESGTTDPSRYAPTRPEMDAVPDEREASRSRTLRCSLTSSRSSADWRRAATGTSSCRRRRSKSGGFLPKRSDLYSQARVTCQTTKSWRTATGNPVLERQLFLLDCRLPEGEVKERHPTLVAYLEEGKAQGIAERYICRHRSPWYAQERRPAAPFLCTYLGRSDKKNGRPFRFILNHSNATAPNVYLMLYPRGVP